MDLLDAFSALNVAVVGDLIADEFIYGRVSRVSREAPVLILQYASTEILPGGAGNAANNIAALGARASLIGFAGTDEPGKRLRAELRHVNTKGLLRPAGYCTPVKTRILAGGVHTTKQQIVRIDRVVSTAYDAASRREFARAALKAAAECDAILLSDYGTGLVTPELATALAKKVAPRARRRPVPILIDSRYGVLGYRGLTACTPNESEVEQVLGIRIGDNVEVLERAGRAMLRRTGMRAVLITRGSRGMALFEAGRPAVHLPIYGSDEVADVTGAGDTVIATMTLAIAAGGSFYEAARLANYAGGLVVMKRGTATVTTEELRGAIDADATGKREGGRGKGEGGRGKREEGRGKREEVRAKG